MSLCFPFPSELWIGGGRVAIALLSLHLILGAGDESGMARAWQLHHVLRCRSCAHHLLSNTKIEVESYNCSPWVRKLDLVLKLRQQRWMASYYQLVLQDLRIGDAILTPLDASESSTYGGTAMNGWWARTSHITNWHC